MDLAAAAVLMDKKNKIAIYELLKGVLVVKSMSIWLGK
jgi:hypothetical protein